MNLQLSRADTSQASDRAAMGQILPIAWLVSVPFEDFQAAPGG
jgi:hypothetical protein